MVKQEQMFVCNFTLPVAREVKEEVCSMLLFTTSARQIFSSRERGFSVISFMFFNMKYSCCSFYLALLLLLKGA